jgi:DNA-binding response OmpR family regulator
MEAIATDVTEPRARARILIVDDERALVGVLAMLLGDAGYEFVTAYDGETALRRIRDDPPDLVLLDLGLPRLSGDEVARTIVERALAPVIILTGRKEPGEIARLLDLGVDDYVSKPFAPKELLARVRATLRRAVRVHGNRHLGGLAVDPATFEARVHGRRLALTPTEFRLLGRLVRGGVISNKSLLRAGWPEQQHELRADLLRAPIRRLRLKLEAAGGDLRVENLRGVGYRITPSERAAYPANDGTERAPSSRATAPNRNPRAALT